MIPWVARIRTTRVEIVENPVRQILTKCRQEWQAYAYMVSSVEVLAGELVFRGTRIGVKHVADLVHKGAKAFPKPGLCETGCRFGKILVWARRASMPSGY